MAGQFVFGAGRIITTNATVSVQNYSITFDAAGGTIESYSDLTTGIDVLITLFSGDRDGSFGTDAQRDRGTLSGVDASLNRCDTRFQITDFPDESEYVGTYWRIDSPVHHPAGRGGILAGRITCQISRVDFPIVV